jgi:hypothetical protein
MAFLVTSSDAKARRIHVHTRDEKKRDAPSRSLANGEPSLPAEAPHRSAGEKLGE